MEEDYENFFNENEDKITNKNIKKQEYFEIETFFDENVKVDNNISEDNKMNEIKNIEDIKKSISWDKESGNVDFSKPLKEKEEDGE